MTLLDELARSALLGTQRVDAPRLSADESPLGHFLTTLNPEQPEALLLNAAGALSIYEQIGRTPRRLVTAKSHPNRRPPATALDSCSSQAAASLSIMLSGNFLELLPEFLTALAAAQQCIPPLYLPTLLDHGTRNASTRSAILPVLDECGRWLAGQNADWRWAAPGAESWDGTLELWKTDKAQNRQTLLRQQRVDNPALGLRLLQSTWKAEDPTRRAGLIGMLETGLSMGDEPFLEIALDDRIHAVRKKAAELLASLPQSRLCRRMVQNTAQLFHWEPQTDEQIRLTFPEEFDPAIYRDGVLKRPGKDLARIRSHQLIEIMGAIPLNHWTESWDAAPEEIIKASATSKWPGSLLRGLALAAERQRRDDWATLLLTADGFSLNTLRLIPILPLHTFETVAQALNAQLFQDEPITKESTLVKVLRKWPAAWPMPLVQIWLERLSTYTAQDTESKTPDVIIRSTLRQMARQVAPHHIPATIHKLRPLVQENIWRPAVLEALSILNFRKHMRGGRGVEE